MGAMGMPPTQQPQQPPMGVGMPPMYAAAPQQAPPQAPYAPPPQPPPPQPSHQPQYYAPQQAPPTYGNTHAGMAGAYTPAQQQQLQTPMHAHQQQPSAEQVRIDPSLLSQLARTLQSRTGLSTAIGQVTGASPMQPPPTQGNGEYDPFRR